jgi:hypothetical protein
VTPAEVEAVIAAHEYGRAWISPPRVNGVAQPAEQRLVCRDCHRRGLGGALRDWRDYAEHIAREITAHA